jgi:uncharacterized protein
MTDGADTTRAMTLARWEIQPRDGSPVVRGDLRFLEGTEPASAVVICHGFKGFKDWGFFPTLAREIALRGHAAVSFNFSHSGVGADGVDFSALHLFAENTHSRNVEEIHGIIAELAGGSLLRKPPTRLGLFGHSRGGGEAVLAAAGNAQVDALVTWAAIASVERWSEEQIAAWRRGETVEITNARTGQKMPIAPGFLHDLETHRQELDILRAAERVTAPWLIVHGEADESVAVEDARRLHSGSGSRAELLLIADAGHTFSATHPLGGVPEHLRIALEDTCRWFDIHLSPSTQARNSASHGG